MEDMEKILMSSSNPFPILSFSSKQISKPTVSFFSFKSFNNSSLKRPLFGFDSQRMRQTDQKVQG